MAIWIVKNSGKISYGIKRYLCDTLEDLPYSENGEVVIPGSKAYVISEKKTYMMGSDEEWHEIDEGSGGASSMSQLTDVDLTNLEDGQVLKYDEDTQTWKPGDDASATSLGNLDDVDLTNLQDGQVIIYDSTTEKWLASDIPSDIAEITQVQYDALPSETKNLPIIYQISDKGYFFYKGKKFRASKELTQAEYEQLTPEEKNDGTEYLITDATTSIGDIDDVSISGATDGQSLYYDATLGVWKNSAGKIVYAEIDDVLDAGETTITFTSDYITADSVVDVFVDDDFDGVTYETITIASGSVTLTFNEQATDMPIMIRVWIDGIGAANAEINDLTPSPNTTYSGDKIEDELDKKPDSNDIAPDYDNTQTYNPGDVVVYNNNYYITNQTINIPEDFDPTKWTETTIVEIIESKIGSATLAGLSDTTITAPANKQLLGYDSTSGKWINITYVEGSNNTVTGVNAHAEGSNNTAAGANSHVEGTGSGTSAAGAQAHAEGSATHANAVGAHSEGNGTTASGIASHAEGGGTVASGAQSHAEGGGSQATGAQSHAEGGGSVASAQNSHAEGTGTIAASEAQHVVGKYNIEDNQDAYVEIVGNGNLPSGASQPTRSNARTLDWQGNETLAGDLIINGNTSVGQALQGIPDELSDLDDVVITSPANNQVLKYNATTGKWANANESGGGGGASDADDVSYDNTTSQLTATNVQDAIDELVSNGADKIEYDPTVSGLTSDTIQEAIDEIAADIPDELNDLDDVTLSNKVARQGLAYDATNDVWKNMYVVRAISQSDYDNLTIEEKEDGTLYLTDGAGSNPNDNLAPVYDSSENYYEGDLCIYDNQLYRCINTVYSSSWSDSDWEPITINDTLINEYDNSYSYEVGEICIHNNKIYKCTATGGGTPSWDFYSWEEVKSANAFANADSIAPNFENHSSTFEYGDFCFYHGKLYRCITNSTSSSSWSSSDWEEVTLSNIPISDYDSTTTSSNEYEVGDVCFYKGTLFRCISSTYGSWSDSDWTPITINELINAIDKSSDISYDNTYLVRSDCDLSVTKQANFIVLNGTLRFRDGGVSGISDTGTTVISGLPEIAHDQIVYVAVGCAQSATTIAGASGSILMLKYTTSGTLETYYTALNRLDPETVYGVSSVISAL